MIINPILQEDEEYYCLHCDKTLSPPPFIKNGNCPYCTNKIHIKLLIDNYDHSCLRVKPIELEIGEMISLDLRHIYEILSIEEQKDAFRIALKRYRAINIDKDSILTKVDGSW